MSCMNCVYHLCVERIVIRIVPDFSSGNLESGHFSEIRLSPALAKFSA